MKKEGGGGSKEREKCRRVTALERRSDQDVFEKEEGEGWVSLKRPALLDTTQTK